MGWDQLAAIYAENAQRRSEEESSPPEACPNDGTPLVEHDGVWHCSHDGYRWPS